MKHILEGPRQSEGTTKWFVWAIQPNPDGPPNGYLKIDGTVSQWFIEPTGLFPSQEAAQAAIDRYNAQLEQPSAEDYRKALEAIVGAWEAIDDHDDEQESRELRQAIKAARILLKGQP